MRQHEPETLSSGKLRCKHCGAAWANDMGISCIDRPGSPTAPARRVSALDDIDALHGRMAELRREREAVEAATAAPELPLGDPNDMCCG